MDSMDELRSPSLPTTSPAAPIIVFPLPFMLSVLQLLGTIRCPEKPRAAQRELGHRSRLLRQVAARAHQRSPLQPARLIQITVATAPATKISSSREGARLTRHPSAGGSWCARS